MMSKEFYGYVEIDRSIPSGYSIALPKIVIIDLMPVLRHLSTLSAAYDLYRIYPLKELIKTILEVPVDLDYEEVFLYELHRRASEHAGSSEKADELDLDWESISFFVEEVATMVTEHIASHFEKKFNYSYLVFDKWLDEHSVVIKDMRYV